MENQDLSQKTVIVLVVLTVLISAFGTIAVLTEVGHIGTIGTQTEGTSQANVKLEILTEDQLLAKQSEGMTSGTGKVSLNILPS